MKILLAITGASGVIYGKRLYEKIKRLGHDIKLIISENAKTVAELEGVSLPNEDYDYNDIAAPPSSGSSAPDVMIIAPCSIKTLGKIANGIGNDLITRAAEVCLKERKQVILVVRETPLSYITIKNMKTVTLAGGVILPASPGFYHNPKSVDDMIEYVVEKVLNVVGIEHEKKIKWE